MTATSLIVNTLTLIFGIIWVSVNIYNLYPLLVKHLSKLQNSDVSIGTGLPTGSWNKPSFDIYIPAYREGDVIRTPIESIRSANYPAELVNVYVLTEPRDDDTRSALQALEDEFSFTELVVPEDYPGSPNKPRALNYAFNVTNNEIIGIIDAEDTIDPDLFQKAGYAIAIEGSDFAQGIIDLINEDNGWLNILFRAEYSYWYRIMVPAFHFVNYPIPLSGTTCFFSRALLSKISEPRTPRHTRLIRALRTNWVQTTDQGRRSDRLNRWKSKIGPWDPTNVTEDFELGLFLWDHNYDLALLRSITREESPEQSYAWLKQRTRWQKGKLYTFSQYIQSPPEGVKSKIHLFWQSALPHIGPINFLGVLLVLILPFFIGFQPMSAIQILLNLCFVFAVLNIAINTIGYYIGSDKPRNVRFSRSIMVILTLPLYWLMQWLADIRALKQLYLGESHWEKTVHLGQAFSSDGGDDLGSDMSDVRGKFHHHKWLLAIVGIAIAIRVYELTEWSLWADEAYSITVRGSMGLGEMFWVSQDPHPPLYYATLQLWMRVFGDSLLATRTLSVLFGVLTIVAVYHLGHALFNRETGIFSALLIAVSVVHISASRTVRMYSLLTLLSTLSMYYFVRVLQNKSPEITFGYIISTVLLLHTHIFAVFVVLVQNIYAIFSTYVAPSDQISWGEPLKNWISLQAIVGACLLPWLSISIYRIISIATGTGGSGVTWIQVPTEWTLAETLLIYAGYPMEYPILAGTETTLLLAAGVLVVFALAIAFAFGLTDKSKNQDLFAKNVVFLALFVLVLGIPFVISIVLTPIYVIRYTIPATIGLYIVVGYGLSTIQPAWLKIGIVGVLCIALAISGAAFVSHPSEEDWEGASEFVDDGIEDGDIIVYQPYWTENAHQYYLNKPEVASVGFPEQPADDSATIPEVGEVSRDSDRYQRLTAETDQYDRIWVVNYGFGDPGPLVTSLQEEGAEVDHERFGVVEVYFFDREATDTDAEERSATD